jgi:hypothetical protein
MTGWRRMKRLRISQGTVRYSVPCHFPQNTQEHPTGLPFAACLHAADAKHKLCPACIAQISHSGSLHTDCSCKMPRFVKNARTVSLSSPPLCSSSYFKSSVMLADILSVLASEFFGRLTCGLRRGSLRELRALLRKVGALACCR